MEQLNCNNKDIIYYPAMINRCCAALDELNEFKNMPDGYFRIMIRLIKKMDIKQPEKAIFARRETLANETGKSEVTVNRALKWLEERELISRSQRCKSNLKGSDSPISPTKKLIDMLGFGKTPAFNTDSSVSNNKKHNINKQYQREIPSKQPHQAMQGVVIPTDLAWLVTDGKMKAVAVLKLMKLARQSGKLLSDIVAVTKEWLLKLDKTGHILFAYLRKLIAQDKDFSYLNQKIQTEQQAKVKLSTKKQEVKEMSEQWHGKLFQSLHGKTYRVDRGFVEQFVDGIRKGSSCLDTDFIEAVMQGRVKEILS